MPRTYTVTIGSKKWCQDWAIFHRIRAFKYFNRAEKWPEQAEAFIVFAMHDMFMSYMWEDTTPWAKEK